MWSILVIMFTNGIRVVMRITMMIEVRRIKRWRKKRRLQCSFR